LGYGNEFLLCYMMGLWRRSKRTKQIDNGAEYDGQLKPENGRVAPGMLKGSQDQGDEMGSFPGSVNCKILLIASPFCMGIQILSTEHPTKWLKSKRESGQNTLAILGVYWCIVHISKLLLCTCHILMCLRIDNGISRKGLNVHEARG
jgi:hypothetical protein